MYMQPIHSVSKTLTHPSNSPAFVKELSYASPACSEEGYYAFSAKVTGVRKNLDAKTILKQIEVINGLAIWPAYEALVSDATRVKVLTGALEAEDEEGTYPTGFWHIGLQGDFHVIKAYKEDVLAESGEILSAKLLDVHRTLQQMGEFLKGVEGMAELLFEPMFEVKVTAEWSGLYLRHLVQLLDEDGYPSLSLEPDSVRRVVSFMNSSPSKEVKVITSSSFIQPKLRDELSALMDDLCKPLFLAFNQTFQKTVYLQASTMLDMRPQGF